MDENSNQQYGTYDPNQQGAGYPTSDYSYPQDQQGGAAAGYTASYNSQYGQGYDSYGYSDPSSPQGQDSQGQGYNYDNQQYSPTYDNAGQSYTTATPAQTANSPVYKQKPQKDSVEKVKFLLFLVPIIIAVFAIFALVLELGVIGMNNLRPSVLFGIEKPTGDSGEVAEVFTGYDDCKNNSGILDDEVFPVECEKDGVVYYKSYAQDELEEAITEVEKSVAESGRILFVPRDEYEFKREIKGETKVGSAAGVANYIYTSKNGETYQMFVNNKYLYSEDDENEILVDKVIDFIDTGEDYDGDESLISKAFGDNIAYTISLGELDVEYPGVDKLRVLYAVDGDYLAGELKVKVFAQRRDNIILLEKVISPDEYVESSKSYADECADFEFNSKEQEDCYLEFLSDDKDIRAAAEKDFKDMVSIFALEE